MKKLCASLLVVVFLFEATPLFAVDGKGAAYFGGTVAAFVGAKDPLEGLIDVTKPDRLVFTVTKGNQFKGQSFAIPFKQIFDMEYGQKAGRRLGATAATTVLLGPIGLLGLFSKKRKHFLTIGFKDDANVDQVAVIELGKDIVRTTIPIIETRSGKKAVAQDEEAQKSKAKPTKP